MGAPVHIRDSEPRSVEAGDLKELVVAQEWNLHPCRAQQHEAHSTSQRSSWLRFLAASVAEQQLELWEADKERQKKRIRGAGQ